MYESEFSGCTAIVTGAGSGIGRAVSQRLAADGATVVVSDVDVEAANETVALIERAAGASRAQACDVTEPAQVDSLFDDAAGDGGIDILVACAGITRDNLVHKLTPEDWRAVIETHLNGSFFCAQAAQRWMVPTRKGKIVLFSSGAARGNRGQANYSAAKGGIESLTRTLALELGRFGINVNSVAPGFVDTPMARRVAERSGVAWETFRDEAQRSIALGTMATPNDIAGVVRFLCSADAGHVTGQIINVRGGP